jgi:hypothetical protein
MFSSQRNDRSWKGQISTRPTLMKHNAGQTPTPIPIPSPGPTPTDGVPGTAGKVADCLATPPPLSGGLVCCEQGRKGIWGLSWSPMPGPPPWDPQCGTRRVSPQQREEICTAQRNSIKFITSVPTLEWTWDTPAPSRDSAPVALLAKGLSPLPIPQNSATQLWPGHSPQYTISVLLPLSQVWLLSTWTLVSGTAELRF